MKSLFKKTVGLFENINKTADATKLMKMSKHTDRPLVLLQTKQVAIYITMKTVFEKINKTADFVCYNQN